MSPAATIGRTPEGRAVIPDIITPEQWDELFGTQLAEAGFDPGEDRDPGGRWTKGGGSGGGDTHVTDQAAPSGKAKAAPSGRYKRWLDEAHQHAPLPRRAIDMIEMPGPACNQEGFSMCVNPNAPWIWVDTTNPPSRQDYLWAVGIIYGTEQAKAGAIAPQLRALGFSGWSQRAQAAYGGAYAECALQKPGRNKAFCATLKTAHPHELREAAGQLLEAGFETFVHDLGGLFRRTPGGKWQWRSRAGRWIEMPNPPDTARLTPTGEKGMPRPPSEGALTPFEEGGALDTPEFEDFKAKIGEAADLLGVDADVIGQEGAWEGKAEVSGRIAFGEAPLDDKRKAVLAMVGQHFGQESVAAFDIQDGGPDRRWEIALPEGMSDAEARDTIVDVLGDKASVSVSDGAARLYTFGDDEADARAIAAALGTADIHNDSGTFTLLSRDDGDYEAATEALEPEARGRARDLQKRWQGQRGPDSGTSPGEGAGGAGEGPQGGQARPGKQAPAVAGDLAGAPPRGPVPPPPDPEREPIAVGDDVERAAELISQGIAVQLDQPKQVSTLLGRLDELVKDAEAKGADAPVYDLCKVTVRGTNIFCVESRGIPRVQMPQLKGEALADSKAAKLGTADRRNETDITDQFIEHLKGLGYTITPGDERADHMRASQRELDGKTVAGIVGFLRDGGTIEGGPLVLSEDNYILDGHHRWASDVAIDLEDNHPGDVSMPVLRVNVGIDELIEMTRAFAADWGIPQRGVGQGPQGVPATEGVGRYSTEELQAIVADPNADPSLKAAAEKELAGRKPFG